MEGTRKILISPDYGAGWSTWMTEHGRDSQAFALFYRPLIEALESEDKTAIAAAFERFVADWKARFGGDSEPYMGGARDLEVYTVNGPFQVEEYDGSESLRFQDSDAWF